MRKILSLFVLCASLALSACESSVDVNATANVPAQYSSVLVTVKEVWFNESATAVPEDTTWEKFPLAEPVTLNLSEDLSGTLSDVASQLELSAGEYRQVRLYLADRNDALTSSASAANAKYNDQVTYVDASGTETTLPLEVANSAQGIGIQTDLKVKPPTDAILAASIGAGGGTAPGTLGGMGTPVSPVIGATTGTNTTAGTTDDTFSDTTPETTTDLPTDPNSPSNGVPGFGGGTRSNSTVTATSHIVFDAARDLTPFQFGDQRGFLLNPTLVAYDGNRVGTIQGQLDLSALTSARDAAGTDGASGSSGTGGTGEANGTGDTGRPDIQVTAEKLNDDSTRRVLVASAPVSADGTFVLYPLPLDATGSGSTGSGSTGSGSTSSGSTNSTASDSDSTTYDLVIHGPGIRTVILRDVPATAGAPDNATNISIGTLTLAPADSYSVNLAADSTAGTRGSRVGFYQTLPDDEAPFLIELRTVDPLSGRFATDELLSAASTVMFGTYSDAFSFEEAAPREGASKYSVAAQAPLYGEGAFASTAVAPAANAVVAPGNAAAPGATTAAASTFTVPSVAVPPTASSGTIATSVSVAAPGKYDKGALVVTHDGAVIAVTSLDDTLAQSQPNASINVTEVPASTASGFAEGYYYLEVWAWNSADPAGTFSRQPSSAPIDLRSTLTANAAVNVN